MISMFRPKTDNFALCTVHFWAHIGLAGSFGAPLVGWLVVVARVLSDMIFVKSFTQPDFQAKNFTPQKRVNCDIFLVNQQRKCIKY